MPVQSNQCHKDPQRWRDNPPFQKPSQHNECNRKQWQIVVTPMAISQKVGKGQFLPKVGRAVLYIYIYSGPSILQNYWILYNYLHQIVAEVNFNDEISKPCIVSIEFNPTHPIWWNPSWVSQDEVLTIQKLTMFAICTFKFSRKNILNRPMLTLESSFMCRFIDVPFQNSSIS